VAQERLDVPRGFILAKEAHFFVRTPSCGSAPVACDVTYEDVAEPCRLSEGYAEE
jgi:hypothetical protein